jgi:hypothetical protein
MLTRVLFCGFVISAMCVGLGFGVVMAHAQPVVANENSGAQLGGFSSLG